MFGSDLTRVLEALGKPGKAQLVAQPRSRLLLVGTRSARSVSFYRPEAAPSLPLRSDKLILAVAEARSHSSSRMQRLLLNDGGVNGGPVCIATPDATYASITRTQRHDSRVYHVAAVAHG